MNTNEMKVKILADGTVRIDTGSVGGPEHMAAEKMLQWIAEQLGGQATREQLAQHHHHHNHQHQHQHAGHEHGEE